MAYVLPTIAATTPSVINSITYGIWAMCPCKILDWMDPNGPADPSGPHSPMEILIEFTKGRIHPDGYFEAAPGVAPVIFEFDNVIAAAQSDAQLQSLLNTAVSFLGTKAKNLGLI